MTNEGGVFVGVALIDQYISIKGLSIHYAIAQPAGRVKHRALLLCAPGFLVNCWQRILPELTEAGCLCVICEMPGFGKGQFSDDLPIQQDLRARYLWGLLDAVDLHRERRLGTWHLIGHGSACGTLVEMAHQQPDSVPSLFMISPMLYPPLPGPVQSMTRTKAFNPIIRRWMRRNLKQSRWPRTLTKLCGGQVRPKEAEEMRKPLIRMIGHENVTRQLLCEGYAVDPEALSGMFMPAMVLWGGEDRLLGGEIPKKLKDRDCPDAEYHTLTKAGHCAMQTHSKAVRDFLRGWIREIWA